jgi:hypothetical protein
MKKRNNLWNFNKRANWRNVELKKEYNVINRELERKTQEAVREFEKSIIEKSKENLMLIYSYVNSKCRTKSSIEEIKRSDGGIIRNKSEIANALNVYFGSVHSNDVGESIEIGKVTNSSSPN